MAPIRLSLVPALALGLVLLAACVNRQDHGDDGPGGNPHASIDGDFGVDVEGSPIGGGGGGGGGGDDDADDDWGDDDIAGDDDAADDDAADDDAADDDAADDDTTGDDDTSPPGAACLAFFKAYIACYAEAGYDISGYMDPESLCIEDDGSYDDAYNCGTEVIQSGDCGDIEAASMTVGAAKSCWG